MAPAPIELRLQASQAIENVCVVGNGLAQPIALITLNENAKGAIPATVARDLDITLDYVNKNLDTHERIAHIIILPEAWTVENGILTPSLKVKRNEVEKRFETVIAGAEANKGKVVFQNR